MLRVSTTVPVIDRPVPVITALGGPGDRVRGCSGWGRAVGAEAPPGVRVCAGGRGAECVSARCRRLVRGAKRRCAARKVGAAGTAAAVGFSTAVLPRLWYKNIKHTLSPCGSRAEACTTTNGMVHDLVQTETKER